MYVSTIQYLINNMSNDWVSSDVYVELVSFKMIVTERVGGIQLMRPAINIRETYIFSFSGFPGPKWHSNIYQ